MLEAFACRLCASVFTSEVKPETCPSCNNPYNIVTAKEYIDILRASAKADHVLIKELQSTNAELDMALRQSYRRHI